MSAPVFLITPPFTQLNTPYPATAYLKGFLNTKNISSFQADLGIEVILDLFNKDGLAKMFDAVPAAQTLSANAARIFSLRDVLRRDRDTSTGSPPARRARLGRLLADANANY